MLYRTVTSRPPPQRPPPSFPFGSLVYNKTCHCRIFQGTKYQSSVNKKSFFSKNTQTTHHFSTKSNKPEFHSQAPPPSSSKSSTMAAPTTTADSNYTDFTKTVTEILTPLTTTDSSSSSPAKTEQIITEAVTKLTDLANSLASSSSPQDTSGSSSSPSTIETNHPLATLLSDTFSTVFKIVKSTPPQKQTPIIDFLRSLRTHTVSSSSSPSVPLSYENMKIWSDLPTFGWTARDTFNFDPNAASSAQEKQGWENLTSFLAALTAISGREQDGGGEVFDFSLFGLWTLREALEEEKQERGAEEWVKLATVWILVAGERLKELSLEGGGKELEGRVAIAGSKYEKEKSGWRGFNPDRWAVWRKEFERAKGWVKDQGIRGEVEKVLGLGVWQ